MVSLTALWLPILISAVAVFAASSVIHMFLGYHADDYGPVPEEDRVQASLREAGLTPGEYVVPHASDPAEMKDPEFLEKCERGPVAFLTVLEGGQPAMGKQLFQWFVYSVAVGIFVAYVTGRALGPDAEYLSVFRFAGTTAFVAYAVGLWQNSIWYGRRWSTTLKNTLDGLVYGLLTAGIFGWLWPG